MGCKGDQFMKIPGLKYYPKYEDLSAEDYNAVWDCIAKCRETKPTASDVIEMLIALNLRKKEEY